MHVGKNIVSSLSRNFTLVGEEVGLLLVSACISKGMIMILGCSGQRNGEMGNYVASIIGRVDTGSIHVTMVSLVGGVKYVAFLIQ